MVAFRNRTAFEFRKQGPGHGGHTCCVGQLYFCSWHWSRLPSGLEALRSLRPESPEFCSSFSWFSSWHPYSAGSYEGPDVSGRRQAPLGDFNVPWAGQKLGIQAILMLKERPILRFKGDLQ